MELLITTSDRPSVTVCVVVDGAVDDDASVRRLEDGLRAAFQFRPDGAVILDLTNVNALSPEALTAVLGSARLARRQHRRLVVYGVRPDAAQGSQIRRLHAALTALPDTPSAHTGGGGWQR